jgi:hypothetical protein
VVWDSQPENAPGGEAPAFDPVEQVALVGYSGQLNLGRLEGSRCCGGKYHVWLIRTSSG